MEEDLESSLFYSCMSSASTTHHNDDELKLGSVQNNNVKSDGSIDAAGSTTIDRRSTASQSFPSAGGDHSKDVDSSDFNAPTSSDNTNTNNYRKNDVPSNPSSKSSSNSSWSVLSENQRPIVRSITFNRDRTCLILSTSIGVRIRTLESLHIISSLQNLNVNDDAEGGENNTNQSSWVYDVLLPPDGATYAQLLHNTSLLAVVKPSSPRICHLYNAKNASSPICALPLSAAVKRVELQRKVLVAMTADLRLHIFHMNMNDDSDNAGTQQPNVNANNNTAERKALRPTLITTLNIFHPSDSARNVTRGFEGYNAGSYFDLSPNEDEPYLVCKSFNGTPGTVRVYDPTIVQELPNVGSCSASLGSGGASTASSWDRYDNPSTGASKKIKRRIKLLTTINAHDHSVTRMLIGGCGGGKTSQGQTATATTTFLATASSKGTTIRLFGLPTGDYLWEWHRGSRACQFYSLSWNGSGDRLATHGSSGTIHVFANKKEPTEIVPEDNDFDDVDFEKVLDDDEGHPRVLDAKTPSSPTSKPLLKRLGSSIKRRATGSSNSPPSPPKHRSCAKLKYKQSSVAQGSSPKPARSQTLVLALLDRDETIQNDISEVKEDRLVLCTMDGELRQYSVKKKIELTQIEDVLMSGRMRSMYETEYSRDIT